MNYRFYAPITGMFVSVLLISNIASTKIVSLDFISFDGGTLLFPLSYIFSDILTEVYGFARSRAVIWTGFISAILMSVVFLLVGILPASPEWQLQASYDAILGFAPRIVLASIIAYFIGEFANSFTLSKLKVLTNGKYQRTRFICSTIVGQSFDTVLFSIIAFAGVLSVDLIVSIIIFNYLFKLLVEIVLLPVTCRLCDNLKRLENTDSYDYDVNYNPFRGVI